MGELPRRLRLPDFAGRAFSLPSGPESWEKLKPGGSDVLLLGPGPQNPWELPFAQEALARGANIFWLENPDILPELAKFWQSEIPPQFRERWRKIAKEEALAFAKSASVYFYSPGLRLAPEFWSDLVAKIALIPLAPRKTRTGVAWLPGSERMLLHRELRQALAVAGYGQICEDSPQPRDFLRIFGGNLPEIAISVNFRGLDPNGRIFALLRELNVPLAIWLVDNPWNLLQGVALPWWREASLFVTDASFIAGLKEAGAKSVWHLPLAASQHMIAASGPGSSGGPLFIGRSAFPEKKGFFAGVRLDESLRRNARQLIAQNQRPDFHWWRKRCPGRLWPDKSVRVASLGADESSAEYRGHWLKSALAFKPRIIGDSGWQSILPGVKVEAPVDYYGELPRLYAQAGCVLNATSLLLPEGLNQRHFDVWAAGGILLTDITPGLAIFPQELVKPVGLASPDDLGEKLADLNANKAAWNDLAAEWRSHILEKHTYSHRLAEIQSRLGLRSA